MIGGLIRWPVLIATRHINEPSQNLQVLRGPVRPRVLLPYLDHTVTLI